MAVPHEKPQIGSLSRISNACRWVQSMPRELFTMCLAWVSTCSLCFERGDNDTWGFHTQVSAHAWLSPHKKLHIGSLLQLPNGSLCTDCVPQGLLTLWAALVNIYLLSFNRGDSHAWGFHAQMSGHAWLSPMRNHKLAVCPTFQRHVCR